MTGGGGGPGGGAVPLFGIRGTGISGLEGKIYDLKQTPGKWPSGMTVDGYLDFFKNQSQ